MDSAADPGALETRRAGKSLRHVAEAFAYLPELPQE